MKAAKLISGLLTIFVTLPIWFFILRTVLMAINADRLTWFLFWIYIPVGFFVSILQKIAESEK